MSRLHDRLIENYAEHYRRVNASIDPTSITDSLRRTYAANYGELIREVPDGGRVLDLGSGTGKLLIWLNEQPGVVPVGVDSSPTQVEVAKKTLPQIEIECGDGLEFLRAHSGEFAGILCNDVLEHIPGDDALLEWVEAVRDALSPGGFFRCRSPNGASLLSGYSRYRDLTHVRAFTATSMIQLLEAAGLERCRATPIRGGSAGAKLRLAVEAAVHQSGLPALRRSRWSRSSLRTSARSATGRPKPPPRRVAILAGDLPAGSRIDRRRLAVSALFECRLRGFLCSLRRWHVSCCLRLGSKKRSPR